MCVCVCVCVFSLCVCIFLECRNCANKKHITKKKGKKTKQKKYQKKKQKKNNFFETKDMTLIQLLNGDAMFVVELMHVMTIHWLSVMVAIVLFTNIAMIF